MSVYEPIDAPIKWCDLVLELLVYLEDQSFRPIRRKTPRGDDQVEGAGQQIANLKKPAASDWKTRSNPVAGLVSVTSAPAIAAPLESSM